MSSTEHVRLQSMKKALIEDLKPKYVMNDLCEANIITKEEKTEIFTMESSEQAQKLIDILFQKSSDVVNKFFEVLGKEDEMGIYYPWFAEKFFQSNSYNLKDEITDDEVNEILVNGGVPFQTNCLVPREEKLKRIREKLYSVTLRNKKRHWVVLHGMTGTGKSVLAAEAVRDSKLIDNCFPEGVFWISVGNLQDDNAVGLKLKKLFRLMNAEEKYIASTENLDDLTHELRKIVRSKKILLILDDVWDDKNLNVVALFDIKCPILVTTNFRRAFENYSAFCSFIECDNDFSIDESKKLLAQYVGCENHMLPPFVDSICRKCKKSPFIVSHIGRWMAPYGNDVNHWLELQKKFEAENGTHSFLRSRHTSGDDLEEIKNIIRSTLDLKQIEKYKDHFLDFVIFPEDVWVCQKVLEVVWSKPSFDASIIIDSLAHSSLVQYENDSSLNVRTYGIHDLYLEILKEICYDTKERNLRLVNNYLRLCKTSNGNYDFSLLPKDDYIHYYIGHHMVQVENMEIIDCVNLDQIYFDLKFIESRLMLDSRDLLWDYQTYRSNFKDQKQLQIFEQFVRKVASKKHSEHCDIIQWGLFEPKDSIIYDKALALALTSKDKSYFKWCNQEENQSHMLNLNSRLTPYANMKHAAISSDGQLIACAGIENVVRIFSSETGEELLVLTGHSSKINCCVFSSCQSIIASASDDKSVRIFEINIPKSATDVKPTKRRSSMTDLNNIPLDTPDMSNMVYTNHFAKVLCCNFSPDGKLMVSGDSIRYVHVWNFKTGDTKYSVYHFPETESSSLYPVHYCSFSYDGTLFGAAAYDSLTVWNVKDNSIFKTFSHDDMRLYGFCFSKHHIISVSNNNIHKHHIKSNISTVISLPEDLVITSCSLSPDGNFLSCGTSQCTVLVHNINTDKRMSLLKGHKNYVISVMYAGNNQKLLSISEEGYIVHNVAEVKDVSLIGFQGNLSVQYNSEDLTIACSNSQNSIEIRKGTSGELYCKSDQDCCDITACSLSNNCTEVVYGTKNGSVKVFNIPDKFLNDTLPNHYNQINYIVHSKIDLFFTCSEDTTIKVWKEKIPQVLKGHTQSVVMCVPFKKSYRLLSCSKDGRLIVWDIESCDKLIFTEGHGNQDIRFCDISCDETYMASASADCTVKVWYCENGQLYRILNCNDEVRCCRFSSNYQVLIFGCDSGDILRWQLGMQSADKMLYKHESCVFNIYFSHDDSKYLTIADDIIIGKTGEDHHQTLQLPSFYAGVARPSIWVSDDFDIFVVIHDSVLYVLEKIVTSNGNSSH